jgi:hypothetical protein
MRFSSHTLSKPELLSGFFLKENPPMDPATKYCQGAPSISASFAEMGGKAISLFSCRINSAISETASLLENRI